MAYSSSDDDSQQRFALGFLFALIALVVSTVVGVVVYQRGIAPAAGPAVAVAEPVVVVVQDEASVRVENGVVLFFFATAKADVAAGANEALAAVVQGVGAGKRAQISGFHDATGNADANAELAKQRALAVSQALQSLGVPEGQITLVKPAVSQGTGNDAQARRVEVILVD